MARSRGGTVQVVARFLGSQQCVLEQRCPNTKLEVRSGLFSSLATPKLCQIGPSARGVHCNTPSTDSGARLWDYHPRDLLPGSLRTCRTGIHALQEPPLDGPTTMQFIADCINSTSLISTAVCPCQQPINVSGRAFVGIAIGTCSFC